MRKCFVHIGIHKTGTTSIQHLLSRKNLALKERGYYYPHSGRLELLPGHHNLAWEISRDKSFQNQNGAIEDLIREVKHRSEDVILSSEAFVSTLHDAPTGFAQFVSLLQSTGFSVTILVYLRNQIDSLPSLYLTLMHHRMNLELSEILRPVLDRGSFEWENRTYNFDYCDVLARLRRLPNVDVIVKSYEQVKTGVCSDFLSFFNLTLQDLHVDEEIHVNTTLPLSFYLKLFLENRLGRVLSEDEIKAVNTLASKTANSIELSPGVRSDIFQRFKESNRELLINYGIPEPNWEEICRQSDSVDAHYVDELFVENIESLLQGAGEKQRSSGCQHTAAT